MNMKRETAEKSNSHTHTHALPIIHVFFYNKEWLQPQATLGYFSSFLIFYFNAEDGSNYMRKKWARGQWPGPKKSTQSTEGFLNAHSMITILPLNLWNSPCFSVWTGKVSRPRFHHWASRFTWVGYVNCTRTSLTRQQGDGEHRSLDTMKSPPPSSSGYLTTSGLLLLPDIEKGAKICPSFHAQVIIYVRLALQSLILNLRRP